jgi:hypothetical protein
MKKGYWVVAYKSVSDDSARKAYAKVAVPVVESVGGRFLTLSSGRVQAHELVYSKGPLWLNLKVTKQRWRFTKAKITKRRCRHSDPAQNETFASSKACSSIGLPGFPNQPRRRMNGWFCF